MKTTTLNEILECDPCGQDDGDYGWSLLLKNLGKTKADDEPLSFMEILKSNGIKDAVWALRVLDFVDIHSFLKESDAAYTSAFYADETDVRKEKWAEIEQIFIKHFGGES